MDNDTIDNNCHYFLHFFDVTQKFRLKVHDIFVIF